ncbi:hypothetical protein BU16DRAFT_567640 [Lophium mytilinum]|uniref:Uncharacterized protein n=1 Tax=Lophium mytilinum TaxID=390894 RepID=A0A6A6QBU3_9PEZI|nr:hypothetical protein BU16DRAFT_567640 [Lophium mytilinum]
MPRPKRTKVASTRVAQAQAPTAVSTRRNPPRNATTEPPQISGDGDGLVIAATKPRVKHPWDLPEEPDVDYYMTGGLGEGDVAGAHKLIPDPYEAKSAAERKAKRAAQRAAKKITPDKKHAKAIEALKKKRDEAAGAKAKKARKSASPEVVIPSRRTSGDQATEASSDDQQPTSAQKPAPSPTPSPSPAKGAYPPSALKAQGTPAMETSMMALTNFKRRSRQPSILRMVQQPSSDDNESDVDLDFLDDFNPDNESTPLHVHKQSGEEGPGEESTLRSASTGQSSGSRKRKAPSPEVQVPASSPPAPSSPPADFPQSSPLSRLATPSEHILETQENQLPVSSPQAPEVWSSTMAPPLSSSPEPSSPSKQPEERHPKRRKTDEFDDLYDVTPRASDDEAAPTTKAKKPVKARKPARAPTLSTAKLQALLPRRRQQPRRAAEKVDEFDIPSSDPLDSHMPDSDQDELSIVAPRRRVAKTPARGQPAKTAKSLAQLSAKKKPAETKAKRGRPRKDTKSAGVARTAAPPTRTYGRRHSDKENENENEDSVWVAGESDHEHAEEGQTTIEEALMSRELREQAEKFRKIDQVELEFESVDMHGSSSPWR